MKIFKSGGKLHWVKNLYLRWKYGAGAGCCDVVSLHWYLAKRIIKPLKEFRKRASGGYPAEFKSMEEWMKIVDEMIWAFEYFLDDEYVGDEFNFEKIKEKAEREQKGFELFGKYFRDLWY